MVENKTELLIFAATYNEVENIENFLNQTLLTNVQKDILIIDDNSPDKTWEIIEKIQKEKNNVKLIKRNGKEGLDTAHKKAFKYAKDNKYTYLITMDADLSHDPALIPEFLENLNKFPFVIGSRYSKGGKNEMKLGRYLLSFVGNKIIKFVLGIKVDEFTTSYRGFNLNKLKNFDMNDVVSKGYSFFMETVFLVSLTKNEIKQIPIHFKDRKKGKSKIPTIESFRTLKNLFLLKLRNFNKNK